LRSIGHIGGDIAMHEHGALAWDRHHGVCFQRLELAQSADDQSQDETGVTLIEQLLTMSPRSLITMLGATPLRSSRASGRSTVTSSKRSNSSAG